MQRVLVLCATIVSFSTVRGDDIREQVRIKGAFVVLGMTQRSAAFSPDGKLLVTASTWAGSRHTNFGGGGGGIIFWDPATGKQLGTVDDGEDAKRVRVLNFEDEKGGKSVGALVFTPDGRTLAGACGTDVCLWDVQTRKLTGRLKGSQYVHSMTFSADGTMLATECGFEGGVQSDVQIWRVKEEKVVATLKAKGPGVRALAFSGDGKSLAVGYGDGTIRVWDVKAERETARLRGHPKLVSALAFEPGDRTLLSTGVGRAVDRWDLTTGKRTAMTSLKGAAEPPYGLAFGPDLATLVMAHEGGLSVWDTKTGARVSNLKTKLQPGVVAFSPDGKWIAADPSEDETNNPPSSAITRPLSIQVWAVGKPADK
jgi:WD40 repeat protein